MSWLKHHFQTFVVPGLRTLVKDYMRGPNGIEGVRADVVKPFDGIVRPSQKCKLEEAGLVYTTLASVLPKNDPQNLREKLLSLCETLDGTILTGARTGELGQRYTESAPDVVHSIIWNSMRSLRRRAHDSEKGLLLLGRDVWPWEILSRRRNVPTVYDSTISRGVAGNKTALLKRAAAWQVDYEKSILFDTGFAGSIHRAVVAATGRKPELVMLSSNDPKQNQLYPGHAGSRGKALAIEYFPKYWQTGKVEGDTAVQFLAGVEEFVRAALLSVWIWHHVSPRFIRPQREPKPKPATPVFNSTAWDIVNVQPMTGTGLANGKIQFFANSSAATTITGYDNWSNTNSTSSVLNEPAIDQLKAWGQKIQDDYLAGAWHKPVATLTGKPDYGKVILSNKTDFIPISANTCINPTTGKPVVG